MGAVLNIVQAPAVVAQESASRVLNAGLVDRLGAMNAAVRSLRDMGYRVVAQTLFPVRGGKPEVLIDRDRQASIGPLLDRSRGRQWRTDRDRRCGQGGVTWARC